MAKTNTEKPSGKNEQKKNVPVTQPKPKKVEQKAPAKAPLPTQVDLKKGTASEKGGLSVPQEGVRTSPRSQKTEFKDKKKKTEIKETKDVKERKEVTPPSVPQKTEEKKIKVKKIKKEFTFVDSRNLPISTKHAASICKFIKNKPIQRAIKELEEVIKLKKAIPMRGEIPHRKGKIMSGRFPVKASEKFINVLKGLQGNANQHDINEPIIKEAIANKAQRPYGRFGRVKKKRSHVKIIAFERSKLKIKKEKKSKKVKWK